MRRFLFTGLAILVLSISIAREAAACECTERPGPCTAFTRDDVVFVGRVVDMIRAEEPTILIGLTVRFEIEQPFKGLSVTRRTVDVKTGAESGDCGYDFKPGQRYLVFASQAHGSLYTSICTNNQPISDAQDDIELINALRSGRAETRIFGRILLEEKTAASPAEIKPPALAGMRVEARNASTVLFNTTDADGRYQIKNVPPGRYVIRVVGPFPPDLNVWQEVPQNVDIRLPSNCGGRVNFPAYVRARR